ADLTAFLLRSPTSGLGFMAQPKPHTDLRPTQRRHPSTSILCASKGTHGALGSHRGGHAGAKQSSRLDHACGERAAYPLSMSQPQIEQRLEAEPFHSPRKAR